MQLTTTPTWAFEASALVYSAWARAYEAHRAVQKETNDGSKDWAEFHAARLANAKASLDKWTPLKDEASRISTLAIREAGGA